METQEPKCSANTRQLIHRVARLPEKLDPCRIYYDKQAGHAYENTPVPWFFYRPAARRWEVYERRFCTFADAVDHFNKSRGKCPHISVSRVWRDDLPKDAEPLARRPPAVNEKERKERQAEARHRYNAKQPRTHCDACGSDYAAHYIEKHRATAIHARRAAALAAATAASA